MFPGQAVLGCCLVYFHFLWAILWPHTVYDIRFTQDKCNFWMKIRNPQLKRRGLSKRGYHVHIFLHFSQKKDWWAKWMNDCGNGCKSVFFWCRLSVIGRAHQPWAESEPNANSSMETECGLLILGVLRIANMYMVILLIDIQILHWNMVKVGQYIDWKWMLIPRVPIYIFDILRHSVILICTYFSWRR